MVEGHLGHHSRITSLPRREHDTASIPPWRERTPQEHLYEQPLWPRFVRHNRQIWLLDRYPLAQTLE